MFQIFLFRYRYSFPRKKEILIDERKDEDTFVGVKKSDFKSRIRRKRKEGEEKAIYFS